MKSGTPGEHERGGGLGRVGNDNTSDFWGANAPFSQTTRAPWWQINNVDEKGWKKNRFRRMKIFFNWVDGNTRFPGVVMVGCSLFIILGIILTHFLLLGALPGTTWRTSRCSFGTHPWTPPTLEGCLRPVPLCKAHVQEDREECRRIGFTRIPPPKYLSPLFHSWRGVKPRDRHPHADPYRGRWSRSGGHRKSKHFDENLRDYYDPWKTKDKSTKISI